jgi:hypothetical protein
MECDSDTAHAHRSPHTGWSVPAYRGYVHAAEVVQGTRLLFISGLNGFEEDGKAA